MTIAGTANRGFAAARALLRRLRDDRSGLALIEFAYSLPLLTTMTMAGAELTNFTTTKMRVSQLALHVADNAARMGTGDILALKTISETQINDVFAGANLQGGRLNLLQNVMFKGATQVTTWYLTLIDNSGYTGVSTADTHASHSGWTEFTSFSGSRPAWSPGTPASGALASSAATSFTISAAGNIRGIAVVSLTTKGSTDGASYLWATALAPSAVAVADTQVLQVYYTNTFTAVS